MPAGYDAEVAELFQDLRAASGLTESELAAQLATRIEVVQALEHGALYALPAWPETCRVVATYGTMLNLDVRPLLQRIYAQLDAGIVELGPKSAPDMPVMTPRDDMNLEFQQPARPMQPPQRQPQPGAPQPSPPRQPGPPQQRPPQAGSPQPPPQQWPQAQPPRPPQAQPQPPRAQPLPPSQQPQGQPQQPPWAGPQGAPQPQPGPYAPPQPAPYAAPQAMPSQPAPRQTPQPASPRALPGPAPVPAPVPATQFAAEPPLQEMLKEASTVAKPARKGLLRSPLLKWGLAALVGAALLFGLWTLLAKPGLLGSSGPTAQSPAAPTDPNDPRSRKADRLPGPS